MKTKLLGSLLILTEDSALDGHKTLVEVVKRMLQLVVPAGYQTHRLGFEPKNEQAQRAVRGAGWKSDSKKHHADLTLMLRTIATKLGRKDGFVLFHIDGDRMWADRALSENKQKFDTRVRARVRQILVEGFIGEDAEARLGRLFLIMPFYSIEAWLYQHTVVAIRLCRENKKCNGQHVVKFEAWKKDRAALDDVERPKEAVCFKSSHNLECAGSGYPAQEVYNAGRSYKDCVDRLKQCAELKAILDATNLFVQET